MEILSTKSQIKEFKDESLIWMDMIAIMREWKEDAMNELEAISNIIKDENLSTASALIKLGNINGRIEAINYLSVLPDFLITNLEIEKDDTKRK